jgi:hypothetical protein
VPRSRTWARGQYEVEKRDCAIENSRKKYIEISRNQDRLLKAKRKGKKRIEGEKTFHLTPKAKPAASDEEQGKF